MRAEVVTETPPPEVVGVVLSLTPAEAALLHDFTGKAGAARVQAYSQAHSSYTKPLRDVHAARKLLSNIWSALNEAGIKGYTNEG